MENIGAKWLILFKINYKDLPVIIQLIPKALCHLNQPVDSGTPAVHSLY